MPDESNGQHSADWWRPEIFARRRPLLEARARLAQRCRAWYEAKGFIEVDTPALQISPGLEPHLMAFATELRQPGAPSEDEASCRYLHTSPEFAMKKLLVAGMPRIFQLAHVFRNEQRAATHSPEFTMLEWYRADCGYEHLIDDCSCLLRLACEAASTTQLRWGEFHADPFLDFERLSVAAAFERHCGIDLLATAPDPADPDLPLLAAAARPLGIYPHEGDRWEDLFFRIMMERIEPNLGVGRPTILMEYPISMAALARPKPSDPRVAERFELYACGVELANAFGELTDAEVQARRFEADMALKQQLYGERYPVDEELLKALAFGMPPAAGCALGFDRLVMLATHAASLSEVVWTPVS